MRIGFIIPDKEMPWDSVHQGVGYVAAYAKERFPLDDHQVFRTYGAGKNEQREFLQQDWDVVGLTVTNPMIEESASITRQIKSLGSARIVVGGSEVTTLETEIFEKLPLIDYAVMGEGEITFYELLVHLKNGGERSKIKGLVYRDENGRIHKNRSRGFEKSLGVFPHPDRRLFKYKYKFHSVIGTRGCPYHCTFCNSSTNWGHKYRVRTPESIAEEVQYIISLYGRKKVFAFNDDSFNIKKDWVIDVCRKLEALKISWWIRGLRASLITDEVADSLVNAGCYSVACGVESANDNALAVMRKDVTIEQIMRGVNILVSRGIWVHGQFIIGNQGDTLDTVKESIECARHFPGATFGVAYPIPHTALYDYVKSENLFLPEPVPVEYKGKTIDWILFDTPHFTVEERLKAVDLAIKARVHHNVNPYKSMKIAGKLYKRLTFMLRRNCTLFR